MFLNQTKETENKIELHEEMIPVKQIIKKKPKDTTTELFIAFSSSGIIHTRKKERKKC